jgi:hypothetical protein
MPRRASPSVGHGENTPDASAYLKALALEVGMQKRKDDLREKHKRVRAAIEGSAVVLKDLDTLYKKRNDSPEEIEGWLRRQFAAFSSLFVGLRRYDFLTERDQADRMDSRRMAGRLAGIVTDDEENAKPPAGLIEDELQAWTEGFQEGAAAKSAAEPVLADILAEALQVADAGGVVDATRPSTVGRGLSKAARARAQVEMVRAQAEADFEADKPTGDETTVGA